MYKIGLILLLTVVCNRISAQVSVSGKIRSFQNVALSLTDMDGNMVYKNELENSKPFSSGELTVTPDFYKLMIDGLEYLLWLDNKEISIKGLVDSKTLSNSFLQIGGDGINDSLTLAEKEMKAERPNWSIERIKTKYSPVVLAGIVYKNIGFFNNKEEDLRFVHAGLAQYRPNTKIAEFFNEKVKRVEGFREGAILPIFSLPDRNGKMYSGTDFKGKLVLIDFWASWCGPCRTEMKSLHKIYDELKGDDIVFLSISIDEHRDKWLQAMEADGMPWLGLWNDKANTKLDLNNLFGFQQIPFIILVDKSGKIVARNLRGEQVRSEILKHRK